MDTTYEMVSLKLVTDQTDHSVLNGIEVKVSHNGRITTYTYSGEVITFLMPPYAEYTISFPAIENYYTPEEKTFVAIPYGERSEVVTYVYDPAIDLSKQDIHGTKISPSTANCYVVSKAGLYKFPLVFGNAIKNGETNSAAYTKNSGSYSHDFVDYKGTVITSPYIEEVSGVAGSAQLSIADTNGIFTDISIQNGDACRYVRFNVSSVPSTGANGVISIKDSSGVIMWSWHIWVWPHDLTPVTLTNSTGVNYNILPVNLASTYDSDGVHIKNWFYQFGRPTPLLGPASYKSNTNATSYGVLALSVVKMATYIYTGIQNPNIVYYSNNSTSNHLNWFSTNSNKALNLWDAACTATGKSDNAVVKTVYDPCPVGFHVPNGNTFSYFSTSNVVGSFDYGYKFKRNSSDSVGVFFPASGNRGRTTGVLENVGSYGSVWTSASPSLNYPAYLRLYSGSVTVTNNYRAFACSIRPVQEQ